MIQPTVVLSLGYRPNKNNVEELSGMVQDTYVVGDSNKTGNILSAVREGFYAGINI